MAVFLMSLRAVLAPGAALAPMTTTFDDIDGSFARVQIRRLAALGVTSGIAPGLYGPQLSVTREQMAQFIVRIFESL